MKTVVYTGPTLSREEVLGVVPGAQVRPPVSRGDLLSEGWSGGDTAVLIDGYYRERLSVGHKEILWLLNVGVTVIGAASMGALRAAELSPYGMSGAGSVYRMYAEGEIDGDDEVAVLHGPAELGYPASTVAMVNLRYGCAQGVHAELGARIVETAKALPFSHRTWQELEDLLGEEARETLATLERRIAAGEWDLKRLDALAALRTVAKPHVAPEADALTGITHYEALKWRSMREYAPGRSMCDLDVLTAARLFWDGYPQLHEEVLNGLLDGFGGDSYVRAKLGASAVPPELAVWLTGEERDLPEAEQLRLVVVRVWPVWQSADWRPAVLEGVRASGQWQELSDLVVRADEVAAQTRGRVPVPPPEICARIFLRHWLRPGSSAELEMARRGFFSLEDLGRHVRKFFPMDVKKGR